MVKSNIAKKNTLFILDWDDTLFPTNWVIKNGINLMNSNTREQYVVYFQELDRVLYAFLKNIILIGKVVIVTNALLDWINISSIVLPKTFVLLTKIKIVSARGSYKHKSNNIMDWKIMAFHDVVDDEFNDKSLMHVISIGDAEYEYQALIALNQMKKTGDKKYLKSVRFIKNPSHDLLIEQLEMLNIAIPDIWQRKKHLDLLFDTHSSIEQSKQSKQPKQSKQSKK